MTPDPSRPGADEPDDLPGLDAGEEELVRRLLAEAAPPAGALPGEVATRLDTVLAALQDERRSPGTDELAARRGRRRSRLRTGLVAAAVVAVVGTGIGMLPRLTAGGGSASSSAGPASSDAAAGNARQQREGVVPPGASTLQGPGGTTGYDLTGTPARLRSSTLVGDVVRVAAARSSARALPSSPAAGYPCALPAVVPGAEVVAVRLDGKRATLVLDPATGGTRVARVYACDSAATPFVRTTVPAG